MLRDGVVERSNSPWASPVILVSKKDGTTRFCVDYRKLNEVTIKDCYPIPRIDESLESIGKATIFSVMDMKSGYWQVPLDDDAKSKSAFVTSEGLYQFNRMPFGLCNAPATFQRLMDGLFSSCRFNFCLIYLDDLIVFSRTFAEHIQHLKYVFEICEKANIRINPKKSKFAQEELLYLGHSITANGIKPDVKKVECIQKFPVPKSVKELQAFLGLVNFYRRFISKMAHISAPLLKLLKKDESYVWTKRHQSAFDSIKSSLSGATLLHQPDFELPFCLATDASGTAIGACLSQTNSSGDVPIAFASRSLNAAERNYSTIEREMLAIYWSIKYFKHYLNGQHFTVKCDHKPLSFALKNVEDSKRLLKWNLYLSDFNFNIIYTKGNENVVADALSRINIEKLDYIKEVKTDEEKGNIMLIYHKLCGHGNWACTKKLIEKYYTWETVTKDVKEFVASCDTCQRFNKFSEKFQVYPILGVGPFCEIGIDLIGPIDSRYIVAATCLYSKYAVAKIITNKEANTIAEFIKTDILLKHGPVFSILSDNGTEFVNKVIEKLTNTWNILHPTSSPYYPQGNGIQERTNGTLLLKLGKLCFDNRKKWEEMFPYAIFAYYISYQDNLGFSPFEVVFGRTPNFKSQPNIEELSKNEKLAMHIILKEIVDAKNLLRFRRKNENCADMVSKEDLEIGDIVLVHDFLRSSRTIPKLSPRRLGPFKIVRKGRNGYYTLEGFDGRRIDANRTHLQAYREPKSPLRREEM